MNKRRRLRRLVRLHHRPLVPVGLVGLLLSLKNEYVM